MFVGVLVRVYSVTHAHTLHMWYLDVSPGVRTRHLEGPKDPDGLILDDDDCFYDFQKQFSTIA